MQRREPHWPLPRSRFDAIERARRFTWRKVRGKKMLTAVFELARPLLYALDPEQAHELTLKSLEAGIYPRLVEADDARLGLTVWGVDFPNPLGIAPGFDKDARVPDAILGMGFGHAEIGTVTPLAQPGNPRPRVFRLIRDRALINRLGFNNSGHAAALARLAAARPPGRDRGQCRRQQGRDRSRGRLRGGRARLLRRSELFHDQRVLSQHARPARSAGAGGAGRACRARACGPARS